MSLWDQRMEAILTRLWERGDRKRTTNPEHVRIVTARQVKNALLDSIATLYDLLHAHECSFTLSPTDGGEYLVYRR